MKKAYALKKVKDFLIENYAVLILILLFILIKASYLSKAHNVIWDESVYLGMGKYLFSSGSIGFWEIVRPIGLPLMLGLIWKTGVDYVFFSELLAILFSVGAILFTYLIGKSMVNKKVGFIASLILAITSVFFLYTNYMLTEIPSTFFILVGIYIYVKKNNLLLAGMFCGIGALFRFPQGIILVSFILGFFIFSVIHKNIMPFLKKSMIFASGFLLIHIPFLIFNYIMYNKETSKLYHALFRPWILGSWAQFNPAESVITGTSWSYIYNFIYYAAQLLKENTLLLFIIPGLAFIFRKKIQKTESFSILVAAFFVYFIYFTYILNKQARFLIQFLPYACLISAYGFYYSFLHSKRDRIKIIIVLFVIISIVGVVSRDLNYYDWRVKDELPVVKDYYRFFEGKEIKGPILTTDPVPVAYIDAEFIPFYFSVDQAAEIYPSNKENAFAVIFSPESFYCAKDDKDCRLKLRELSKSIEDENEVIFSGIYGDRAYYIYLNKKFA